MTESLHNLLHFITFQHFLSDFISNFFPSLELRNSFYLFPPCCASRYRSSTHAVTHLIHTTGATRTSYTSICKAFLQSMRWFSKRHSPASTKQGTARLFLPSSYELKDNVLKVFSISPIFLCGLILWLGVDSAHSIKVLLFLGSF